MQIINGERLLSASDLMRFLGCKHALTLDLLYLEGNGPDKNAPDPEAEILQRQGNEHESPHLASLKASGKTVREIVRGGRTLSDAAAETGAGLAEGYDIIFQAALLKGMWGDWSDFLVKSARPSQLGQFSYEVSDIKLKEYANRSFAVFRESPEHIVLEFRPSAAEDAKAYNFHPGQQV